jgi:GH24 family phage-related lysozyme (muramidase)
MPISQRAFNLIVAKEVTDEATYRRLYARPDWPGGSSGVTIGIGYDIGHTDRAKLHRDWDGVIAPEMVKALERAVGVTGKRAKALATELRDKIEVPWDKALAVFRDRDLPHYEELTRASLPNVEELSADSFGALVSLVYNRGASFARARDPNDPKDRFREMRAIKAHMALGRFAEIPDEIISMKRLWRGQGLDGLLDRRDQEAALFRDGLAQPAMSEPASAPIRGTLWVQQALNQLGATPRLDEDGDFGAKTRAMVRRFQSENGLPPTGLADRATIGEIERHLRDSEEA